VLTLMARSEVPSPFFQQAPAQFIGAAASPVRAHGCRGGHAVQDLGRRARQGESADGPVGTPVCGHRRTRELHVADQTLRAASVRAMPWEGVVPRSARCPDGKAGATRARRARSA
jgi:hypothetical protein